MSDFLTLLESVPAARATATNLLPNGERAARKYGERHAQAFDEARHLLERVLKGDRYAMVTLQEAMSTSDFPLLFGDILDRTMLATFKAWIPDTLKIARRRTVNDFRDVKDFAVDGAEGTLDAVPERTEYPEAALTEARDTWSVAKYGRVIDISWESVINGDLDSFSDRPQRLAKAARRTQAKQVTEQYVTTTGPHTSLYTVGNANIVTSHPALTTTGLATAMTVLAAQTDNDGEPIMFDTVFLVVPPALEITAMNIVNALQIEMTDGGGLSGQKLIAKNWMANRVQVVVDPYIPIVASSSNGSTSWFLFGNPADGRPALSYGVLRGHEEPEIWVRTPNAMRAGGGPVAPEEGSFENDSVAHRVRFVCGATRHTSTGGAKGTVASNGSGS